jgi:NDP-sugar pyrophosphorylase family protein
MIYVILAAGLGTRFIKDGILTPKPMIEILGKPMIGHLIETLLKAEASKIYIVANSRMPSLLSYLSELKFIHDYPLIVKPLVSDNSFYSLEVGAESITEPFIAMTVDTVFPLNEFQKFINRFKYINDNEVLMGLTKFIDDPTPLYARIDERGLVTDYRYGGEPFENEAIISAGIYGLTPDSIELMKQRQYPESLSDFQRILAAETSIKVRYFEFSKAFDVDCISERPSAEEFLKSQGVV